MKAITIKQPWAQLICTPMQNDFSRGIKDVENRTWPCPKKYIGERILVHASAKIDKNALEKMGCTDGELTRVLWFAINDSKLPFGAIIGSVQIVDCVINHPSIWAEKTETGFIGKCELPVHEDSIVYNWVLANPILFETPIPAKGKLRFWEFDYICL